MKQVENQDKDRNTLCAKLHQCLDGAEKVGSILVDVAKQFRGVFFRVKTVRLVQIAAHHFGAEPAHVGIDVPVLRPVHKDQIDVLDDIHSDQKQNDQHDQLHGVREVKEFVDLPIGALFKKLLRLDDHVNKGLYGRYTKQLQSRPDHDHDQYSYALYLLLVIKDVVELLQFVHENPFLYVCIPIQYRHENNVFNLFVYSGRRH